MKNQNGVTLVSLVIYVVVMIIMVNIMSVISTQFYANTNSVQGNVQQVIEFNKFNNYFLREVKANNNSVDSLSNNYILFASGNSFLISNNAIYYNDKRICNEVKSMEITLGKNGDGVDKTIINVTLGFENFNKSISYKVENIY